MLSSTTHFSLIDLLFLHCRSFSFLSETLASTVSKIVTPAQQRYSKLAQDDSGDNNATYSVGLGSLQSASLDGFLEESESEYSIQLSKV